MLLVTEVGRSEYAFPAGFDPAAFGIAIIGFERGAFCLVRAEYWALQEASEDEDPGMPDFIAFGPGVVRVHPPPDAVYEIGLVEMPHTGPAGE